jgi:hypothetical protein
VVERFRRVGRSWWEADHAGCRVVLGRGREMFM